MGNKWEDILSVCQKQYRHNVGKLPPCMCEECNRTTHRRIVIKECVIILRQAEKEGKVCIDPPDKTAIEMIIKCNNMYDYTHAKVGDNMAVFYADQLATAISDRLRKGKV